MLHYYYFFSQKVSCRISKSVDFSSLNIRHQHVTITSAVPTREEKKPSLGASLFHIKLKERLVYKFFILLFINLINAFVLF